LIIFFIDIYDKKDIIVIKLLIGNLIKRKLRMEKFSRRVLEICKQYNLPLIPELKISNKMTKSAGNIRIYGVYGNINKVVITISNHLLK
jgi:hypothetical protein